MSNNNLNMNSKTYLKNRSAYDHNRSPTNIFRRPHFWESGDCLRSIKISEVGKNQQIKITLEFKILTIFAFYYYYCPWAPCGRQAAIWWWLLACRDLKKGSHVLSGYTAWESVVFCSMLKYIPTIIITLGTYSIIVIN